MAITQRCPNCREPHDISVYVTGQRVPCRRCNLKFEVVRSDVPPRGSSGDRLSPALAAQLPPRKPVVTAPWGDPPEPPPEAPAPGIARPMSVFTSTPAARPAALLKSEPVSLEETITPGAQGGTPAKPPPPPIPGFELLAVVGRGGMGEVWRARQLSLGREVAIKTLAAHLAEERDFVRRFEKEATALASLAHPNVVAIFDRGSEGGLYYLVMEFVSGPSLREKMMAGGGPPEWALDVIAQVLTAMEYAHGRGIVHRDLKPENILLSNGQLAKVADFGLAAILGRESSLQVTRPSVAMGTLSYMAPEQRRDAHAVDGRADLYSVAVILYELLTGELPLGRFQLPSRRAPKIDRRIDGILERGLDPDPAARYQSAGELAAALAALGRTDVSTSGLRGWLRRKRD